MDCGPSPALPCYSRGDSCPLRSSSLSFSFLFYVLNSFFPPPHSGEVCSSRRDEAHAGRLHPRGTCLHHRLHSHEPAGAGPVGSGSQAAWSEVLSLSLGTQASFLGMCQNGQVPKQRNQMLHESTSSCSSVPGRHTQVRWDTPKQGRRCLCHETEMLNL